MREILFRGQAAILGKWIEGSLLTDEKGRCYIGEYIPLKKSVQIASGRAAGKTLNRFIGIGLIMVDENTVGQYTGLTDKNGTKIFEGDIVKFAKNIYQIVFSVGSFALYDKHGEMISKIGGHNDHCYSLMDLYVECCWEDNVAYDIEVIGNIYDNPELITEV